MVVSAFPVKGSVPLPVWKWDNLQLLGDLDSNDLSGIRACKKKQIEMSSASALSLNNDEVFKPTSMRVFDKVRAEIARSSAFGGVFLDRVFATQGPNSGFK